MYNQPQNKTQQAYKLGRDLDRFQEFAEGEHDYDAEVIDPKRYGKDINRYFYHPEPIVEFERIEMEGTLFLTLSAASAQRVSIFAPMRALLPLISAHSSFVMGEFFDSFASSPKNIMTSNPYKINPNYLPNPADPLYHLEHLPF